MGPVYGVVIQMGRGDPEMSRGSQYKKVVALVTPVR